LSNSFEKSRGLKLGNVADKAEITRLTWASRPHLPNTGCSETLWIDAIGHWRQTDDLVIAYREMNCSTAIASPAIMRRTSRASSSNAIGRLHVSVHGITHRAGGVKGAVQ